MASVGSAVLRCLRPTYLSRTAQISLLLRKTKLAENYTVCKSPPAAMNDRAYWEKATRVPVWNYYAISQSLSSDHCQVVY